MKLSDVNRPQGRTLALSVTAVIQMSCTIPVADRSNSPIVAQSDEMCSACSSSFNAALPALKVSDTAEVRDSNILNKVDASTPTDVSEISRIWSSEVLSTIASPGSLSEETVTGIARFSLRLESLLRVPVSREWLSSLYAGNSLMQGHFRANIIYKSGAPVVGECFRLLAGEKSAWSIRVWDCAEKVYVLEQSTTHSEPQVRLIDGHVICAPTNYPPASYELLVIEMASCSAWSPITIPAFQDDFMDWGGDGAHEVYFSQNEECIGVFGIASGCIYVSIINKKTRKLDLHWVYKTLLPANAVRVRVSS